MELKLAKDERIIKSWDYAIEGRMFQGKEKKVKSNLTITNKRLVATQHSDIYLKRDEIPVASIKSISGEFRRARRFWAMLKLIVGIPLCLLIVGISMVKDALATLRSADFDLLITTSGVEGSSLGLGAFSAAPEKSKGGLFAIFSLFKRATKTKVRVDREISKEILDELGAVVLDVQGE